MESLQRILFSMKKTSEDFRSITSALDKKVRDGRQLPKGASGFASAKQQQQRIGMKPSIADCLEGLRLLSEMHNSEYLLKLSVVTALDKIALNPRATDDLGALHQLLLDQPNVPREEVQSIYDVIFAEEIS